MQQIDMWAWLHSIPTGSQSSLGSSVSSPPRRTLQDTTFSELHRYAISNVKTAYEALPHHALLRFEPVDQETLAFFPTKANVTKSRLVIGFSKHGFKNAYKPVYAYICKKDQLRQVVLRLGSKHLTVKEFEAVKWETPFDLIYDTYGQTERAGDKIGMMAAFYFLAADHIPEITTRTGNFVKNFTKLCNMVYLPNSRQLLSVEGVVAPSVGSDPYKVKDADDNPSSGKRQASELLPPKVEQQDQDQGRASIDEDFPKKQQDAPILTAVVANNQADDRRARSSMSGVNSHSSLISLSTAWEGSTSLSAIRPSSRHGDQFLHDMHATQGDLQSQLRNSADTIQSENPEGKVLSIDDLTAFVQEFKKLKAENERLHQHKAEATDQKALIDQSKHDAKQAYTQLQDLQERFLDSEAEMKQIRAQLAKNVTESAAKCKKLSYNLGREQVKAQLEQHAHECTQTQLKAIQAEKQNLKERLENTEQSGVSEQKIASMETNMGALRTENGNLRTKIQDLENEIQEEKHRFNEYRRKIRSLSMDS